MEFFLKTSWYSNHYDVNFVKCVRYTVGTNDVRINKNDVKLYGVEEMEALESWEFSNSVDVDGVKGEEVTMISHPGNFSDYQLSQPSNHQ